MYIKIIEITIAYTTLKATRKSVLSTLNFGVFKMSENEEIKRLLILLLLKLGSTSEEIGLALGVDSSAIRHMMPTRKIKKIVKDAD
jgi:hypothetical protein